MRVRLLATCSSSGAVIVVGDMRAGALHAHACAFFVFVDGSVILLVLWPVFVRLSLWNAHVVSMRVLMSELLTADGGDEVQVCSGSSMSVLAALSEVCVLD